MPRKTAKSKKTLKPPAWQRHEILTKWIYKALLDQDRVKNVLIQHNVKVRGIKSFHQIDVYWKFRLAGVEYTTIVQVKKEKRRAEKGEIHKLEGVLTDLRGQPRGVFVTQAGYQKGALEHARRAGIDLIQLSEVANLPPINMTTLSQARMELQLDKLQMKVTVFNTSVQKGNIIFDRVWATEAHFPLTPQFDSLTVENAVLANELGQPLQSLHERVQHFVRDNPSGGELLIEFTEPTYLVGFKLIEPTECRVDRLRAGQDFTTDPC